MIWSDLIWFDLIWFDLIWSDLIWSDLIWSDLIWSDLIWSDPILGCTWYNFHYLQKGKTIYGEYYANLSQRLSASNIWQKKSVVSSWQCISSHIRYHDNQKQWVKVQITSSRTLFARFSPLGFFLFPNLKKWLVGQRFANNEEVESSVNGYFKYLDGPHYKQDINAFEHRWEKCIELKEDYVEKYQYFFKIFWVFFLRSGTSGTTLVISRKWLLLKMYFSCFFGTPFWLEFFK